MEDKERISVSIFPSQLEKLNLEQDKDGFSSRSALVRKILDEYFQLHQPREGREPLLLDLPSGLLEEMRALLDRRGKDGKKRPMYMDEEDIVRHGLRLLLK